MIRPVLALVWLLLPDRLQWCTQTCSVSGCNTQCAGSKGHSGPHLCISHA